MPGIPQINSFKTNKWIIHEKTQENGHENESGYCGNNSIITDTETKSAADINGQTVTGEEMDTTQKSEKVIYFLKNSLLKRFR